MIFFWPIFRLALPFPCSQMEQLKTTSQVTGSHREYLLYEISIPLAFRDLDIISSLNWPGLGIGSPLSNGDPYGFGLGKKKAFSFGLGKRRAFSFGLGKRDPYAFGLGKRSPYEILARGRKESDTLCIKKQGSIWCWPTKLMKNEH